MKIITALKRQPKAEAAVESTTQVVASNQIEPSSDHLSELVRITDRDRSLPRVASTSEYKAFLEAGFRLLVSPSIVRQFRYHASVFRDGMVYQFHKYGGWSHVQYAGDIPDFALERLERFRRLGSYGVTISSNQPLPMEQLNLVPQTDPVMIGWPQHGATLHWMDNDKEWRSTEIRAGRPLDWETRRVEQLPPLGIVIAMWDMDKEITL